MPFRPLGGPRGDGGVQPDLLLERLPARAAAPPAIPASEGLPLPPEKEEEDASPRHDDEEQAGHDLLQAFFDEYPRQQEAYEELAGEGAWVDVRSTEWRNRRRGVQRAGRGWARKRRAARSCRCTHLVRQEGSRCDTRTCTRGRGEHRTCRQGTAGAAGRRAGRPPDAHDLRARGPGPLAARVIATEITIDLRGDRASRRAATTGLHGVPVERVVPDLGGVVEDAGLVRLACGRLDHILMRHLSVFGPSDQLVAVDDVGVVVLTVMDLQCLCVDMGRQRVTGVGQSRKFEDHDVGALIALVGCQMDARRPPTRRARTCGAQR